MKNLDFEEVKQLEINDTINDMHYELIRESIMEQIKDPFDPSLKCNNFLRIYEENYNLIKNRFDDDEIIKRLKSVREDTYLSIINAIEERFGFTIDKDEINIYDVGKCLYEFFVINYYKIMIKFFINYINKNKKDIAEYYKNNLGKDVSTTNLKKAFKDKNIVIILANINDIVMNYVKSLNMEQEFLKYIIDFEDNSVFDEIRNIFFESDIIIYNDNIFKKFFKPLYKKYDGYTNVVLDIHDYLFNINAFNNSKNDILDLIEDNYEEETTNDGE